MADNANTNETPNQGNQSSYSEQAACYLKKAEDACVSGDMVLGLHLYLAAYEQAAADSTVPTAVAITGLREAWHLACDLKERAMAEYIFEKLEPYLTTDEIAACAAELQSLALDRLEQFGLSREDLEGMAEMISQDLIGGEASVVKVEAVSVPNMGMFGVPGAAIVATPASESSETSESDGAQQPAEPAQVEDGKVDAIDDEVFEQPDNADLSEESFSDAPKPHGKPNKVNMGTAAVDDFNPYDYYRDYSIGKSYHAATNEGSGAHVFTRDEERAQAGERFRAELLQANKNQQTSDSPAAIDSAQQASAPVEPIVPSPPKPIMPKPAAPAAKAATQTEPKSEAVQAASPAALNYRSLVGYDEAISVLRDLGIGLHRDRGFQNFVAMLNERHGIDRMPAVDTLLVRSSVIEDAMRLVDATAGELDLPVLRMSVEEGVQGMPVLCLTTNGDRRPRMNHAHNRFEGPAVLVLDNLDNWVVPEMPEGVEGLGAFVMANVSRGAREALGLVRTAVEDPDVYVLATATIDGEVDPFFYELIEPISIIDVGFPGEKERVDIWNEIMHDHPSMRGIDRDAIVRLSAGISRYDIYMSAREALEEAYKLGLVQRQYVPVTSAGVLEKLAACQPLGSPEYQDLEDEVARHFADELDGLEDLIGGWHD